MLVDNGRLDALADVVDVVHERRPARAAASSSSSSRPPSPIGDAEAEQIRARLAEASGHEVTLVRSVDASILGGVIVRVRDRLVDLSVRGRLDALRLSLRNARLGSTGGES